MNELVQKPKPFKNQVRFLLTTISVPLKKQRSRCVYLSDRVTYIPIMICLVIARKSHKTFYEICFTVVSTVVVIGKYKRTWNSTLDLSCLFG